MDLELSFHRVEVVTEKALYLMADRLAWQMGLPSFFLAELVNLQTDVVQLKTHWQDRLPHIVRADAEARALAEAEWISDHLLWHHRLMPYSVRSEFGSAVSKNAQANRYRYTPFMKLFYRAAAAQCLVLDAIRVANAELLQAVGHIVDCARANPDSDTFKAALLRHNPASAIANTCDGQPVTALDMSLQVIWIHRWALRKAITCACEQTYAAWLKRHLHPIFVLNLVTSFAFLDIERRESQHHQPPHTPMNQPMNPRFNPT